MNKYIKLWSLCGLGMFFMLAGVRVSGQISAQSVSGCGSPEALVVVTAGELSALLGKPVNQIALFNYRDGQLSPITIQIDQRDAERRFVLDDDKASAIPPPVLGPNDDIVFRIADGASRLTSDVATTRLTSLIEIGFSHPQTDKRVWVYAKVSDATGPVLGKNFMSYNNETDSVETRSYKTGFSKQRPFLIDSFQWGLKHGWSPNVLDTMKIRHTGNMFGLLSFRRTSNDYTSRLTHIKAGPLRVIRRTENRVRILWKLKTPALYIDYVMMPDSFIMDTIIDIPFNLGLILRDVETLTTVDWRDEPVLPKLTIHSPATIIDLRVNGKMSEAKKHFNTISDTRLSVNSQYGSVFLNLDIPADFPIKPWLYLNDNANVADRPENQAGQFGNVGYRTTGWENIDTEVHHLKVTTCVTPSAAKHGL